MAYLSIDLQLIQEIRANSSIPESTLTTQAYKSFLIVKVKSKERIGKNKLNSISLRDIIWVIKYIIFGQYARESIFMILHLININILNTTAL